MKRSGQARSMTRPGAVLLRAGALVALAIAAAVSATSLAFAGDAVPYQDLSFALSKGAPVSEVIGTVDRAFTVPDPEPEPEPAPDAPDAGEAGEDTEDDSEGGTDGGADTPGTTTPSEVDPIPHVYSFTTEGGLLPEGLSLSLRETDSAVSLILGGTPTEVGEFFCQANLIDSTAGTTVASFGLTIGVFTGPAVVVTASEVTLFDDEQAQFDASASGGTGDYSYQWYVRSGSTSKPLGSNQNVLFYPASGTLSLDDNDLIFYCEVTDNISGLSGVSAYTRISVSCRHTYGDWTEKEPATCTEAQVLARTCPKCETEETKPGKAATGHTWGDWVQSGVDSMTHTCTVCGESETQTLVAGTPFIKAQPTGGSIPEGGKLALTVTVEPTGLGSLSYQWFYAAEANATAVPAQDATNSAAYVATTEGYYFVRITQKAGDSSNTVDSAKAYVHVHNMSVWMVDTGKNTATRVCLASYCPDYESVSETITLDEMMELYPDDAEALGLSTFKIFVARHKVLMLVVGIIAVLAVVAVVVLLMMRKRQREAYAASARRASARGASTYRR